MSAAGQRGCIPPLDPWDAAWLEVKHGWTSLGAKETVCTFESGAGKLTSLCIKEQDDEHEGMGILED